MAESGEEFILLQTLKPVEYGQVLEKIPPHMTTLSWFTIQRALLDELLPLLDQLVVNYGSELAHARGLKRALFGELKNIPGCDVQTGTHIIHDTVLNWVDMRQGSFKYDSFARRLRPHISDEGEVSIQPGDEVNFSTLALISNQNTPTAKRKNIEYAAVLGAEY